MCGHEFWRCGVLASDASGVVARRGQPGHLGAESLDLGPSREAGEAMGLPQGQQALGLVGPGVHRRGRLGLAEVDPVLVPERTDLGALGRVGSPGRIVRATSRARASGYCTLAAAPAAWARRNSRSADCALASSSLKLAASATSAR